MSYLSNTRYRSEVRPPNNTIRVSWRTAREFAETIGRVGKLVRGKYPFTGVRVEQGY